MLRITPLTDDRAAYDIGRAATEADTDDFPIGTFASFQARLRQPRPGHVLEQYVALRDGAPVGHLELGLPQLDNVTTVNLQLFVHPAQRRHGAGRALLGHAVQRAHALGRRHLISPTADRRPDGVAFAAAMGATAGLVEIRSRLALTAVRGDGPVAPGYRLAAWSGVPSEEHVDDIAALDSRLNQDAPVGDLAWEPEKVDAARVRATEESLAARGIATFHTGAVHEASGRMVAWTTLAGGKDLPGHAWQNITIVDPGHRGHGLGLAVKHHNLRYARSRRPALAVVDTFNAAANAPMLRVNEAMGFRRMDRWTQWQLTV